MDLITKQTTAFPQTEAIPHPLEIHPSIAPQLAEEMLRVHELLMREPHRFNGKRAWLVVGGIAGAEVSPDGCGCILAHIGKGLSGATGIVNRYPMSAYALDAIYGESSWDRNCANPAWALERIELFLSTGK